MADADTSPEPPATRVSSPPSQPLRVDADDLAGALAARHQLGADAELAVIAEFLDRTGQAIDARVAQRLAEHTAAGSAGAGAGQAGGGGDLRRNPGLVLALGSIGLGIPVTGAATSFHGSAGIVVAVVAWGAIATINVVFNRAQR